MLTRTYSVHDPYIHHSPDIDRTQIIVRSLVATQARIPSESSLACSRCRSGFTQPGSQPGNPSHVQVSAAMAVCHRSGSESRRLRPTPSRRRPRPDSEALNSNLNLESGARGSGTLIDCPRSPAGPASLTRNMQLSVSDSSKLVAGLGPGLTRTPSGASWHWQLSGCSAPAGSSQSRSDGPARSTVDDYQRITNGLNGH